MTFLFLYSGKAAPNLMDPLDEMYSQSLGTTEAVNCYEMYLRTDLVQG